MDPTFLFASIMFGLFGSASLFYAKKKTSYRHAFLGIALIGFPYIVTDLTQCLAIGGALIFLLFWPWTPDLRTFPSFTKLPLNVRIRP